MRVYLDNCCYNRPFDDQENLAVALETFAKLQIQAQIDYTEWRQNQFEDLSLEELARATRESGETIRAVIRADAAVARLSSKAAKNDEAQLATK